MTTIRRYRSVLFALVAVFLALGPPARADEWGDARKEFRKAQKSEDWKVRREAYLVMMDFDQAEAVDEVMDAMVRETNQAVILQGIQTLMGFRSGTANDLLLEELHKGRGVRRLYALLAISGQKGNRGTEVLLKLLGGKDAALAAQAALTLGGKQVREALPLLMEHLAHDDWQLRAAAARAVRYMAGASWFEKGRLILPLAESLAMSKGRERRDIIDALRVMTKEDFGNDPDAWLAFANGTVAESVERNPLPVPHIYGIPIYGRRLVILVDHSFCTDDQHPFQDRDRLKEVCQVPGAPPVPWYSLNTTADFYAAHVNRLVKDLPERDFKVEMILLAMTPAPTFGKLVTANSGTKRTIARALRDAKPENGMDTMGALNMALDISGTKDSVAWSLGPDEIVFMSCSVPWLSEVTDQNVVGAAIGLKARLRMVPVHTIGIGPHPFELMKVVSEQSGGQYLDWSK